MIYLPSTELIQKMILASATNKHGKMINDENDILERFISTEMNDKKAKVKRIVPRMSALMKQKTS
jgi:hypothetical protein